MKISKSQVETNLRRTANKGLISLLKDKELNDLAKKYYGIKKDNKYIGFIDPYTGEEILDKDDLILEHIIPISSGGGTILFNCIPASAFSNSVSEKGNKHLLEWWCKSPYYDDQRLCYLLEYILEAYKLVFKKQNIDEVLNSYLNYLDETEIQEEEEEFYSNQEDDLETTQEEIAQELKQQQEETGLINYYKFLNDCISHLENNHINTENYREQLNQLKQKGIFEEIELFEVYQNSLKEIIKNKLDEESRRELTILLNYNILSLINSMKEYKISDEIYQEIQKRIDNLETILDNHQISIISYFEDIKNCPNLLTKKIEDITADDIDNLVNSIQLCVADKFNKLINWYQKNKEGNPLQKKEEEKKIGKFLSNIKRSEERKTGKSMCTTLSQKQLQYLANSEDERLRKIYESILYRSIDEYIPIDYVDKNLEKHLKEIIQKRRKIDEIEDYHQYIEKQLEILEENEEFLKETDARFCKLINWYQKNKEGNPSRKKEEEKKIRQFLNRIKSSYETKIGKSMRVRLSQKQLQYLANSEDERLRKIYESILYRSIDEHIPINYVDENLEKHLKEIIKKRRKIDEIEDYHQYIEKQLEILEENEEFLKETDARFCKLINWYQKNKEGNPSTRKEEEKNIGQFLFNIKSSQETKTGKIMSVNLSQKQLQYLANSEDERLRKIYESILYRSIDEHIPIDYVDENLEKKIKEIIQKRRKIDEIEDYHLYIEKQLEILEENEEYLKETDAKFCKLINWYQKNEEGNPSQTKEEEKKIRNFLDAIKRTYETKTGKSMQTTLSQKQLQYLANSEDERLRKIYESILYRSIDEHIPIDYVDKNLEKHLKEIIQKRRKIDEIEDYHLYIEKQLEILEENEEYLKKTDAKFCKLINWYQKNEEGNPSQKKEEEKKIRNFLDAIKSSHEAKEGKRMNTILSQKQLQYLANSEDERLRKIYFDILKKANKSGCTLNWYPEEEIYIEKGGNNYVR